MTKIKVPRGPLKWQLNYVINKQFEVGIGEDRHAYKCVHGHADYGRIYSKSSHNTHVSRIQNFANWLIKEEIKHINQLTPDVVATFLSGLVGQDYKHKTIQNYQSSINHVLYGNEVEGHPIYSVHKMGIEGVKVRSNNCYDKERPEIPDRYLEQFDLIKASGFRRKEAEGVGTKSMYESGGNYYLVTNGKGGRPRYTKIRDDYKDQFKLLYSDYIIKKNSVADIPQTKEDIKDIYRTQKPIFERTIPTKYATHIYRSEYAQAILEEIKASGHYKPEGHIMDVNGFKADRGAFRAVSRELGHNRASIDLLSSYFRHF